MSRTEELLEDCRSAVGGMCVGGEGASDWPLVAGCWLLVCGHKQSQTTTTTITMTTAFQAAQLSWQPVALASPRLALPLLLLHTGGTPRSWTASRRRSGSTSTQHASRCGCMLRYGGVVPAIDELGFGRQGGSRRREAWPQRSQPRGMPFDRSWPLPASRRRPRRRPSWRSGARRVRRCTAARRLRSWPSSRQSKSTRPHAASRQWSGQSGRCARGQAAPKMGP
jgi:hypothetical protein